MGLYSLALSALAAEGPAKFKVGEFEFTRPANWEWVDVGNSPMRKAQLKINGAEQKTGNGEVVFYYFGESGAGGTKANVDRWLGQFQEPKDKLNSKVEEVTVGKRKITFVQAEGTYMSGMPGGGQPPTAQPNSMLLGAILESEQGNVFIKCTGPAKLVKASQEAFRKMARSGVE
jgi:hypothetical protein